MFVHTLLTTTGSGIVGPVIMRDPPLFLGNDLLVSCIMAFFFLSVVFDPYVVNFIKTVSVRQRQREGPTKPRTSTAVQTCQKSYFSAVCITARISLIGGQFCLREKAFKCWLANGILYCSVNLLWCLCFFFGEWPSILWMLGKSQIALCAKLTLCVGVFLAVYCMVYGMMHDA